MWWISSVAVERFRQITSVKVFLRGKLYGSAPDVDDGSPFLSPSLSSLTLFEVEVASVFHLRLNIFTDPCYLREHKFRESTSYWAYNITDLMAPGIKWPHADANSEDEVGRGFSGRSEIWGLAGWYLNLFVHENSSWRPLPIDVIWYSVVRRK